MSESTMTDRQARAMWRGLFIGDTMVVLPEITLNIDT